MSVARHYVMVAAEEKASDLGAALHDLAARVRKLPGCLGVESMQDIASPARFVFIERWTSVEAHKAAGPLLGKDALAAVMACVCKPPDANYLTLDEQGEHGDLGKDVEGR